MSGKPDAELQSLCDRMRGHAQLIISILLVVILVQPELFRKC
jgi:hypothetical protein